MKFTNNFPLLTDKEFFAACVEEFCQATGRSDYNFFKFEDIVILNDTPKVLDVEISKMYDWDLPTTTEMIKFFLQYVPADQYNFDVYDEIRNGGCETCDYGSSYGYCIRFWHK
jgi:hypothetical protein